MKCRAAYLLFVWLLVASSVRAQEPLRWGGDAQGGAPYIFKDAKDPTRTVGFEVDLAAMLARRLGRPPVFVQNQWDGLIPGLATRNYDIVLNGIEITPDREKEVLFSLPYYATAEQLTVRIDTHDVQSLADLKGRKVGTLKASLAQRYLEQENARGANIDIATYDDQDTAYEDLALGRTSAVLMDFPIALYCADPARLKSVGKPIGYMRYGIALRRTDEALRTKIDAALEEVIRSGELRRSYQKWGLWNEETRRLFQERFPETPAAFTGDTAATGEILLQYRASTFTPPTLNDRLRKYVFVYLPILLTRGAGMTVLLSVTAMLVAMALGIPLALASLYGPPPIRALARTYIEAFRGTPLLIQLYLIYYGLPRVGLSLTPFVAAVIGLGLNYAAYEAENYRAGLQSVPRDQREAAGVEGMTAWETFRHILLPQALRLTIPPVTNDFVSLLKDSSIVSVITMVELTKAFGELAMIHFDFLGLGLLTALVYFVLGWPFVRLARAIEARYAHS
ncbi:MAG: ABC transporter substrate-binding protein/permease [Capsulimonadales bacterium]|nr:ABC transporter substrate-binding protein/permease [Capsulimonadales bacterium]